MNASIMLWILAAAGSSQPVSPDQAASQAASASLPVFHPPTGGQTEPGPAAATRARGFEPLPEPRQPPPAPHFSVELGMSSEIVPAKSFARFNPSLSVTQSSLAASATVFSWDRLSVALGGRWEASAMSGSDGAAKTQLACHRLLVELEARYRALSWLHPFARVAGGAAWQAVRFDDGANWPVTAALWSPSLAATGGVAFLLAPQSGWTRQRLRWYVQLEGGYALIAPVRLTATVERPEKDHRASGTVDLGVLRHEGGLVRVSTALTF